MNWTESPTHEVGFNYSLRKLSKVMVRVANSKESNLVQYLVKSMNYCVYFILFNSFNYEKNRM